MNRFLITIAWFGFACSFAAHWFASSCCTSQEKSSLDDGSKWRLGHSFDLIDDLDSDGRADLVLLSPAEDNNSWEVVAVSSASGGVMWRRKKIGNISVDSLVSTFRTADWNGDGISDVLVALGSRSDGGRLNWMHAVISGKNGHFLSRTPSRVLADNFCYAVEAGSVGAHEGEQFSLRCLEWEVRESVGEDGRPAWSQPQLVVSEGPPSGERRAHAVLAPENETVCAFPNWARGKAGEAIDLLVAGTRNSKDGAARLCVGRRTTSSAWELTGSNELRVSPAASFKARAVADCNGDGSPDVLVACRSFVSPGQRSRVVLLSGTTGELLREYTHKASFPTANVQCLSEQDCDFGSSLEVIGDLDGDGLDEFAVGMDSSGMFSGCVVVLSCSKQGSLGIIENHEERTSHLGIGLSAGFDLDGDGVPDFVASESTAINAHNPNPQLYFVSGADRSVFKRLPKY